MAGIAMFGNTNLTVNGGTIKFVVSEDDDVLTIGSKDYKISKSLLKYLVYCLILYTFLLICK